MPSPDEMEQLMGLIGGFNPAGGTASPIEEPNVDFAEELGLPRQTQYTAPPPPQRPQQERAHVPAQQMAPGPAPQQYVPPSMSFLDFENGVAVINGVPGQLMPEDVQRLLVETMRSVGKAWQLAAETVQQGRWDRETLPTEGSEGQEAL